MRYNCKDASQQSGLLKRSRPLFASLLELVVLFSLAALSSFARPGATQATSRPAGVVRLPVIDKQDIQFTQLSVLGESLERTIFSIAQDRNGFLWFGTDGGLYRYDGYTLKPYRRDGANPNSLIDDAVRVVYPDRAGIIWVGTGLGGLDRLDPSRDTFTHYRHDSRNPGV